MLKDIYKWWKTNEKRVVLVMEAVESWPVKQKGTDDLFEVGPFTIHNTIGARGPTLEAFKKMLGAAIRRAKSVKVPGFHKVLYGNIYLVGAITKAHHAAWYTIAEDAVYCRLAKKKWSADEAHALVHELGHRYWHRFADKTAKTQWYSRHIDVRYTKVEVPEPEVGDALPVRIGQIQASKVKAMLDHNIGDALRFPTPYSATDEQEHFCEALALSAFGTLATEHEIPFRAIWGR